MERLIFPGHIGKLEYIMPALQVYVDADDWVNTANYIDQFAKYSETFAKTATSLVPAVNNLKKSSSSVHVCLK